MKNNEPDLVRILHQRAYIMKKPCSGTFELTARCNFNCRMCYVHSMKNAEALRKNELSARQWIDLAGESAAQGAVFAMLTGGEALLREDFEEIYRGVKEKGLLVSVNTNGSLITEKTVELFRKYPPKRINVSLYGAGEQTYKELCGVEAFGRVSENIKKLVAAGVSTKINMSVTKINLKDAAKVHEFADGLKIPCQASGYMFPPARVSGSEAGGCRLSAEDAAGFDVNEMKRYRTAAQFAAFAREVLADDSFSQARCDDGITCRAGRSAFWLDYRGNMLPCGMVSEPAFNAVELEFEQAWQSVMAAAEKIKMPSECRNCEYRSVCNICAAKSFCETGSYGTVSAFVCEMTKRKYELLKKAAEVADGEN